MATIPSKMFEGRTPPDLPMASIDNIDWYNEQVRRSFEGFSLRGTRFTGDQYFFYNFYQIELALKGKDGNVTNSFDFGYPYFSQEDDYLFKQIEEANQDNKGVFLMTGRGFGKCLDPDVMVRMFDGSLKKAKDVKAGDKVMGPDSRPRNVLITYEGEDEMYEVQQHKGMSYIVNSQHTLSLKRKHGVKCQDRTRTKDYIRYPQYGDIANIDLPDLLQKSDKFFTAFSGYKVPLEFEEKSLPVDPYWIGLWLGDGHSHRPGITTKDAEIIQYLETFSKTEPDVHINMNDGAGLRCPTYFFSTKRGQANPFLEHLRSLDLIGNKHIPDVFKYNSRENRLKLLAGIIDSDGHMRGNVFEILQKNERLARDVYDLANTLGFKSSLKRVNKKIKSINFSGQYWRISISGYTNDLPLKINRKKTSAISRCDPYLTGIKSIKSVGYGKYNGFTIDGDSLFVLEDGTVTHNTYIVISIGTKIFYFVPNNHCVLSASGDDHIGPTYNKYKTGITRLNINHPTIRKKLLIDNEKELISGEEITKDGIRDIIKTGWVEKILYDKKPGKTKGRRLDFQHYEEIGDWGGAATLQECWAASEGSWKVGSIYRARVFYTGTGGTVLSGQAKQMFTNPDTYNIYIPREHRDRPIAVFIPSFKKLGGFWEKTGISDEVGAKAYLDEQRAIKLKDKDPTVYTKFIQEYPYTWQEAFMQQGSNRFPQKNIIYQIEQLDLVENQLGKMANLHWKKENGRIVGVEIDYKADGDIWILEEPEIDLETGKVYPNLYVGGYDGIDIGAQETAKSTGTGSQGSLSIKKRLLSAQKTNNLYLCFYVARPDDIFEFYENSLKVMYLYGAMTNIEFTKAAILGYARQKGLMNYFMKRPRLTLTDITATENNSNLYGTTATDKNFQYGENFLIQHLNDYSQQLFYKPALEDLRDFNMTERGKHDITVSMMMAELADDEMMGVPVLREKPNYSLEKKFGYYTDSKGKKRWGEITPTSTNGHFNFKGNISTPSTGILVNYLDK